MQRGPRSRSGRAVRCTGFTLVELLVVVAIVGMLLAILLPAIQRVRDAAARAHCASNLRGMALAVHLYSDTHCQLPQGCAYPLLSRPRQLLSHAGFSWQTSILPYVEQEQLFARAWQAYQQNPFGMSREHRVVQSQPVAVFVCPSDTRPTAEIVPGLVLGLTSYRGVAGTSAYENDGIFHKHYTVRFADITDGASNTLMIGERPTGPHGLFGAWYGGWGNATCPIAQIQGVQALSTIVAPAGICGSNRPVFRPGRIDNPCDVTHFWSIHSGGANFAFADASVRFLPYAISSVLPALATRANGEIAQ